jgi:hypothetical protein
VALPDRPGSLGQVARTLGVVGADIVSVMVLERVGGRAVDDVTVVWPASAPADRVLAGLTAVPGVQIDGVWRGTELSEPGGGRDVALVGQVAANPANGLATVVDAVPALFGADWAAALKMSTGWAGGGSEFGVVAASWRAPVALPSMDIAPLRPRAATAADGTYLAVAPFQRDGLVLVVARDEPGAPPFHRSEVERLAQLVGATAAVLGALVP